MQNKELRDAGFYPVEYKKNIRYWQKEYKNVMTLIDAVANHGFISLRHTIGDRFTLWATLVKFLDKKRPKGMRVVYVYSFFDGQNRLMISKEMTAYQFKSNLLAFESRLKANQ